MQPQEPPGHPELGLCPRAAPEVNGRGSSGPARSGHSANVNRHRYPVSQDPLATCVVLCNLVLGARGLSSGLRRTPGPLLQANMVWLDSEQGGSGGGRPPGEQRLLSADAGPSGAAALGRGGAQAWGAQAGPWEAQPEPFSLGARALLL